MSPTHSSRMPLRCERSSTRIVSGVPKLTNLSARSLTARRTVSGWYL